MAGELSDLFGAVDAAELAEDLKEYGVMAASAIAANVGFNVATKFALSKWPTAPEWVNKYGVPGAAILLGALGGGYASRYNRQVGLGVGVGLVSAGLSQLAKGFFPTLPLNGLNGLGDGDGDLLSTGNPYGRYLSGATSTVETVPNAMGRLNGATVTVESAKPTGFSGAQLRGGSFGNIGAFIS